jgi:Ca2+-binding RTX toxin-like protein
VIHSIPRSRGARYRVAAVGALSVVMLVGQLTLAGPAVAAPYSGGFSPTVIGQLADLNGDGVVTGRDDANAFYGDTHIIDGGLDCNAWLTPNDDTVGNGAIDTADDCTLIGVDGTPDGVTIEVVAGEFQVADGPLPFVFNASEPDNPDVGDSDFAWSTIDGRVDSNGDEAISLDDCHLGLIGEMDDDGLGDPRDGADILGNDEVDTNPCGLATPPDEADTGLVDLNSDGDITAADSCAACFFGLEVLNGFVMAPAVATTLDLTPATDTNPEDTPHTVTANVDDQDGVPMAGVTVRFSVAGANTASGTGVTNASGNATFTYTGANPGTDTITAFADSNGNGIQDPGEPSDTAIKTWTAAARSCRGQPATHVGTSGNDTIVGTSGNDVIVTLGGNDTVKSKGGADVVCAGAGNDTVRAGSGNDRVLGQGGKDFLLGQGGKDRINGGGGRDRIKGGSGRDNLRGQGANDTVRGQGGADRLNGGPGRDLCNGGAGRDTATACEVERLIP